MANSYTRTLMETTAAMSLIPKPAGVLANHNYGRYAPSALYPVLRCVNQTLVPWAMRKFKRFTDHMAPGEPVSTTAGHGTQGSFCTLGYWYDRSVCLIASRQKYEKSRTNPYVVTLQESPRTAYAFKQKPSTCACRASTRSRCARRPSPSIAAVWATILTLTSSTWTLAVSASGASSALPAC